jgi:hypothetical protein
MDKRTATTGERKLRQQLRSSLTDDGPHHAILSALSAAGKIDWRPFLFGGFLRDMFILGQKEWPRDIDVVVAKGTVDQLAEALRPYIRKRTRFGGFHLELRRWHFDIWPLQSTWAFLNDQALDPIPENLPKTTFLNVEAIAAELYPNGEVGPIVESGFFTAVRTRELDINFEPNPYPALAAIRAIATAVRLRFCVSPKLGRYILMAKQRFGAEGLVAAQDSHYGLVRFPTGAIQRLSDHIASELTKYPNNSIELPDDARQIPLWESETTA